MIAPARRHTGGPELLHQLCHRIKKILVLGRLCIIIQDFLDPVHCKL